MSATVALATELAVTNTALATTNANLSALAQQVQALAAQSATNTAAIADLAKRLGLDEQTIASLLPPVSVPTPYDPQIQWRASMETGDTSAWSEEVNTPTDAAANSSAVQVANEGVPARVSKLFNLPSLWAMKQWCSPTATGSAGTRMARYPEINALCKAGTPFYYSWWDFFPAPLVVNLGGWYNHWQIASNDPTGKPVPLWVMGIENGMVLNLTSDPTATMGASKTFRSPVAIPVGQWNFFEVYIVPRSDTTGALKVWLNGQVALDIPNVPTQFPLASQTLLTWITSNAYGMNIAPVPFVHYVDDVSLSLGRMP